MKNLVVLNKGQLSPESRTYPDLQVHTSVFDPISDSITVVLADAEAPILEVQQFTKTGEVKVLLSFAKTHPADKVLSFVHFADLNQLVFVLEHGDLVTATYDWQAPDADTTVVEIVGSIDCGLKCAQWSPDEETLLMVTNENQMLLLSRLFEPILEKPLLASEIDLKTQVSVGWGKKETQFQGKGAKQVERERLALRHAGLEMDEQELRDPTLAKVELGLLSEYDSMASSISWRGDCQYFCVNSVEQDARSNCRRVVRVYSRDGELDSCSEAVDGLEHPASWKPQGALILSTQRRVDQEAQEEVLDVVFFERNGLRHGEFASRLAPGSQVAALHWSCNSEVLCLQLQDSVQLWTCKNYHWSLKQEITTNEPVLFVRFHPEKPLQLMFGTANSLQIVDLAYKMCSGPSVFGSDVGMTCFTDGTTCLVTPLGVANVPPPIGYREFECHEPILDVAVSQNNEIVACLSANELHLVQLTAPHCRPRPLLTLHKSEIDISDFDHVRQVCVVRNDTVVVLYDSEINSKLAVVDITDVALPELRATLDVMPKIVLLKLQADFEALTYETVQGKVFVVEQETLEMTELCQFPQLCHSYEAAVLPRASDVDVDVVKLLPASIACFGISQNGKLYANDLQLASLVTSIKVTESYLLYTTAQHQLKFVHLNAEGDFQVAGDAAQGEEVGSSADERVRMIERGSLLVALMPSKAAVVLQAPRGNLETIYPRIMTLTGVRADIRRKNYKNAFLTCRTHRIDLDILHDYDPELFLNNVELFVNQIDKVEYLDLFVSCLHEEDVTKTKYKETLTLAEGAKATGVNVNGARATGSNVNPVDGVVSGVLNLSLGQNQQLEPQSKVNRICELILAVLLKPEYAEKYTQTMITAYACENPPNLTAALQLIGSFTNGDQVEKAVTHACFLQDVNKLYNVALSLYNVPLTLVIAQQSQKDPKEYLPFLQHLHEQPLLRKKFLIDTHLKNYTKALDSLCELPGVEQQEINDYVVEHSLYKHALKIYRQDSAKSDIILLLYALYLQEQSLHQELAHTYELLGQLDLALENYILGKNWRELLAIALQESFESQLPSVCSRLVASLTEDHKYTALAEIQLKYMANLEEALKLYCKEYHFEIAILTCVEAKRSELIEQVVDPALGEGFGTVAELVADCRAQVLSQLNRLRELRAKKEQDPHGFYGDGVENLDTPDNVSIAASETSTKESFFTRYTGKTAGTAKTGASRRTAKNRRREERKRARGKKGTIYEEEYLVKSTGRLIERVEQTEPELIRLIEGLLRRNMREQLYQIQKSFVDLLLLIKDNVKEIYNISERDRERLDDNGLVYYIPEIPVPEIKEFAKKSILDY